MLVTHKKVNFKRFNVKKRPTFRILHAASITFCHSDFILIQSLSFKIML